MKRTLKIQLGFRFAAFVVGLFMLNWALVALALFAPVALPWSGLLGDNAMAEVEKQVKDLGKELKQTVTEQIKQVTEGLMKKEDLAPALKALGLEDKTIDKLQETIEKQGEKMREYFEKGGNNVKEKTWEEALEEKKADISKLADKGTTKSESLKIELPYSRKTLVQRSAVSGSTLATRLPEVGQIAYMGSVFSSLFRQASMESGMGGVIRYIDQNSITRNADVKAEAAQKPESVINWIERTLAIQKIADSIPVTKEAYADFGFVKSEIDRLLNINLVLKEDQQLYAGTGVAPELIGLVTTAPSADITAAGLADSVESANLYDLIATLRVMIADNKQSKYMPNAVVMNPKDILKYKLLKATDGHYLLPPFVSADGFVIDGIRVIESSRVTANTLVIGDFRFGTQYTLEGITIEMGYVNDQFIKNQWTILAEMRTALLIRNVDADAFLKVADITAAIAELETP